MPQSGGMDDNAPVSETDLDSLIERGLARLREASPVAAELLADPARAARVGRVILASDFALETLRRQPDLPVSRVVCLGSPLRGSLTARNLARHPWSAHALGRSGPLLLSGCAEWRGTAQVGMVAGNVARGFGRLLARFEGDSDGTVSVEETRLPGLSDHCIVAASHTGLVFSAEAAHQAANFLRHGRFTHPQARETGAATGAGTNRGTPASNGRTGAME